MMKRLLAALAFALGLSGCASFPQVEHLTPPVGKVAIMHLDGEIDDAAAAKFKQAVDQVVADKNIDAVLLMVNSPGGGVYQSSLMFDDLARIHVPVVAYCKEICAFGAVYTIMAPSVHKIYVNRATIIGSVGVFSVRQRQDKPDNIDIYKSGKYKLSGVITKKEDGEDEYLQHQIMEMAKTFYELVNANRGHAIGLDDWVHIKNAEVFIGREGVQRGLADGVVSIDTIYKMMKQYGSEVVDIQSEG